MPRRVWDRGLVTERFWARVDKTGGCWLWMGSRNWGGYGQFWDGSRMVKAHRFAYEVLVGPIPDGLQLDHLCRVRHCVNTDHLEPVTLAENVRRGRSAQREKTECPQGHPYDAANTYWLKGERGCRACGRERCRAWRARRVLQGGRS